MNYGQHDVLSRPCRVLWAGWQSTTYDLQRAGWALSAAEQWDDRRVTLAMTHERTGTRMISKSADFDYFGRSMGREPEMPTFIVGNVVAAHGGRVLIERMDTLTIESFRSIDAKPMRIVREDMDDLGIFATPATKGLILDPNDVDALMTQVGKLNQIQLAEVREHNRQRERRAVGDALKLHCQILTLAA